MVITIPDRIDLGLDDMGEVLIPTGDYFQGWEPLFNDGFVNLIELVVADFIGGPGSEWLGREDGFGEW